MKKFAICTSFCLAVFALLPFVFVSCKKNTIKDKQNAKVFQFVETTYEGQEGYEIAGIIEPVSEVKIPSTYKNKPVLGISEKAFYGNRDLTRVTIGKNIKYIDSSAFAGAINLTKIEFAEKCAIKDIENKAFYCANISGALVLPESVKEIGAEAFENCSQMTSVAFSASAVVHSTAFKNCHNISKIKLFGGTIDDISMLVTEMANNFETISSKVSNISIEVDSSLRANLKETIENLGFEFLQ